MMLLMISINIGLSILLGLTYSKYAQTKKELMRLEKLVDKLEKQLHKIFLDLV